MARNETLAFLRELVETHMRRGERRLPSVRHMAVMAGVSSVSVWRAVRRLREEGVVRGGRGRGLRLVALGGGETAVGSTAPRTRSTQAATRLRAAILRSEWQPGDKLPSVKELCARLGVSRPTLRKVMGQLVDEGLVEPCSRGHAVTSLSPSQSQGRVVLIASADDSGGFDTFTFRTLDYFRTLESECSRGGLGLETVPVDFLRLASLRRGAVWDAVTGKAPGGGGRVLGTILIATGMPQECFDRSIAELDQHGEPCAVLDEDGIRVLRGLSGRSRVRLFAIACTPRSGAGIGRHLLAQGHRHVAYISPLHASQWSRARLEGLTSVVTAAGGTVYPCIRADMDYSGAAGAATSDNCRPAPAWSNRAGRALHNEHRVLEVFSDYAVQRHALMASLAGPLMARALSIAPVTAWVCASDYFGFMAYDYLESMGKEVPRDIAVAAFDDSYAAFINGLTSYNFNGPAYMRAMLRHIVQPLVSGGWRGGAPVEIEGHVT
ncbi:MAG: GntR family transcriptional regulator, partial [Chitinivibrionales bacterium]|nr:GntR family transcriptional regulator [Chitinivibrionales bacterium]